MRACWRLLIKVAVPLFAACAESADGDDRDRRELMNGNPWRLLWEDMPFFRGLCSKRYATRDNVLLEAALRAYVESCGEHEYDLWLVMDGSLYMYVWPTEKMPRLECAPLIIAWTPKKGILREERHEKMKTVAKVCGEGIPTKKLLKKYTIDISEGGKRLKKIGKAHDAASLDAKGWEEKGFDVAKNNHGFFLRNIIRELDVELTGKMKRKFVALLAKNNSEQIFWNFRRSLKGFAKKIGIKFNQKNKRDQAKRKTIKLIAKRSVKDM